MRLTNLFEEEITEDDTGEADQCRDKTREKIRI
jgi:hypothetical protein